MLKKIRYFRYHILLFGLLFLICVFIYFVTVNNMSTLSESEKEDSIVNNINLEDYSEDELLYLLVDDRDNLSSGKVELDNIGMIELLSKGKYLTDYKYIIEEIERDFEYLSKLDLTDYYYYINLSDNTIILEPANIEKQALIIPVLMFSLLLGFIYPIVTSKSFIDEIKDYKVE